MLTKMFLKSENVEKNEIMICGIYYVIQNNFKKLMSFHGDTLIKQEKYHAI